MENKNNDVAIFVDYDNVYWTLLNQHNYDADSNDSEKNLFDKLWSKYGRDNIRAFRVYADYEKVSTSMTSLQKKRLQIRHVYSNGKDGPSRKNSSDIELSIDAIETTYKDPKINHYIFVTADSDMIPVLSRMMYKGKRVELYYLGSATSDQFDISSYVHDSTDLAEFLNIEIKKYEVRDFVLGSLTFIKNWQTRNQEKGKTLGKTWLKSDLIKEHDIPGDTASELIEHLYAEEYIFDDKKEVNGVSRANINVTEAGEEYIVSQSSPSSKVPSGKN